MNGPIFPFLYCTIPVNIINLFFFLYKAVKRPGLRKLNRFTITTLIVFAIFSNLPLFEFVYLPNIIPEVALYELSETTRLTLSVSLAIVCIISIVPIWKGKNRWVLVAIWAFIGVFSIIHLCSGIYRFYWRMRLPDVLGKYFQPSLFDDLFSLLINSLPMFAPILWALASFMSLLKIMKENRLNPAADTAS